MDPNHNAMYNYRILHEQQACQVREKTQKADKLRGGYVGPTSSHAGFVFLDIDAKLLARFAV